MELYQQVGHGGLVCLLQSCAYDATVEIVGNAKFRCQRYMLTDIAMHHETIAYAVAIVGRKGEVILRRWFILVEATIVVIAVEPC